MNTTRIKIEVQINADTNKVWKYMNSPEHITRWNFAADDWHCPFAENDLRVGGKIKYRMEAKDGSFGFDFEAIYNEVIGGKKAVYTLGDGRQVVTTLEAVENGTRVTTEFDGETENSAEMQRQGWQAILNNLKKYMENK